jgi:hydrogenase small subunit
MRFGETDSWPIGVGHPCFGCTEQALAFRVPLHETVPIERPTPPDTYPPIKAAQGKTSVVAAGVAGVAAGAAIGAMWAASKSSDDGQKKD